MEQFCWVANLLQFLIFAALSLSFMVVGQDGTYVTLLATALEQSPFVPLQTCGMKSRTCKTGVILIYNLKCTIKKCLIILLEL